MILVDNQKGLRKVKACICKESKILKSSLPTEGVVFRLQCFYLALMALIFGIYN